MRPRRPNIVPYSRDYRRAPRFKMGLPFGKPPRKPRSLLQRLADPLFYLRVVIIVSGVALVALPLISDGTLALTKSIPAGAQTCRVLRVIDGDTADLWCDVEGIFRARLVGFDAPELFSPNCTAELIAAQRAKWGLRGMLFASRSLRMSLGRLDKYDRRLVTVWTHGTPLATAMIEAGYARSYSGAARKPWCE